MTRRPAIGVALLLLGVWIACGAAEAAARARPRPAFAPDPRAAVGATWDGEAWLFEHPAFRARLTRLDEAQRREFLLGKAGATVDPFGSRDDSAGFLTFALELEARQGGSLVFQPQRCRLITNRNQFRHPLDLPTIEASYGVLDREMPETYRTARPALFDGERVLLEGDRAEGLLIYRGVHPKTKHFTVEVLLTTPRGELGSFTVAYIRAGRGK